MKNFTVKIVPWIIIAAMFALLIPGIVTRIDNESKNNNITISALYNDINNKVTPQKRDEFLAECKKIGITTVSVMEEDLNSLVARGDVTCIKYNVLRHKYDDESIRIADAISSACPDVSYDSHLVMVKKESVKNKLGKVIPKKYTSKSYGFVKDVEGMDIYVFYNGRKDLWDYSLGYDEETLAKLADGGFDISLIYKIKNYEKLDYLKDIEKIVKQYDIEYLNLKLTGDGYMSKKINKENYKALSKIINENNMTLVVTENVDQLSNQKFIGYDEVFDDVMSDKGTKKVVRSYETYDDSQSVGLDYSYRVSQFFNSTIDRNIRFVTLTQIVLSGITFEECADYTLKAVKEYKEKIENAGYTVGKATLPYDYSINKTFNYCVCAVLMVMFVLIMCQKVLGLNNFWVAMVAYIVAALAVVATFVMPGSLIDLYPTAYCAIMSCFVMTIILSYVKYMCSKMNIYVLSVSTFAIALGSLLICSLGLGTMLSGINYYINNDIFRGIKISLLVPVAYTMVAYYFVFMKTKETKIVESIKKILASEIKVYWVLIAGFLGIIGMYYIVRSGNVNSISSMELWLRNTVTEIFSERPRTKEFLIGYPALLLFVYYSKFCNIKLINWVIAVGASILAASVTNSFCHVFTNYTTIVMRTINGLAVGILVSIAAYIGNLILFKAVNLIKKRI